jgi:hypothetical protein
MTGDDTNRGNRIGLARLQPQHLADLRKSGLSDDQIVACGFYTETDPHKISDIIGTHLSTKTVNQFGACLVIPYPDANGAPSGFARLKPDRPRKDRKKDGKVVKYEGPAGKPNRAYIPRCTRAKLADPTVHVLFVEGEKKCAAADQHGFACIGLSGVWAWQAKRPRNDEGRGTGPRELIPELAAVNWKGRAVTVMFDSDIAEKEQIQWAEWHLCEVLRAAGALVRVARLPNGAGGEKVGADDFLVAHGPDAFRAVLDAAQEPVKPVVKDDRPEIVIGTDEHRVNAEAAAALAGEPDLYQRGRALVQVLRTDSEPDPTAAVRRPADALTIRELPVALLRERLTKCARWVRCVQRDEGEEQRPASPPAWSVNAVHVRGEWPGVRPLDAVVDHPVILGDGTIVANNGYDPRARLLVCVPPDLHLTVSARPTRADAVAAVAVLTDVVGDFPFETPAHRAAWVAGLLTPLAQFSYDGGAPLLLVDGNTRGVGKGLLADLVPLTLTGRRFAVMSYTSDREELRKKITSLAMEGERLVLLDNLAGAFGNEVLDMALTADRWKDRVLGGNRTYDGPLNVCWYATGNNVQIAADTARRVLHCRLETPHERPELRADLKRPDLRAFVRTNRAALLSAALTILRAWHVAGRPRHGLPAWGSFEGWSGVVREAVVFAGLPDPGETREALQQNADQEARAMGVILDGLQQMDPHQRGVTTGAVIGRIKDTTGAPEWVENLRAGVEDLCGKLDSRALAGRFRQFQRRNFGGRMLQKASVDRTNSNRWVVTTVGGAQVPKPAPAPPAPPPGAGDAGDAGAVSAQPARVPKMRFRSDDRPFSARGAQ